MLLAHGSPVRREDLHVGISDAPENVKTIARCTIGNQVVAVQWKFLELVEISKTNQLKQNGMMLTPAQIEKAAQDAEVTYTTLTQFPRGVADSLPPHSLKSETPKPVWNTRSRCARIKFFNKTRKSTALEGHLCHWERGIWRTIAFCAIFLPWEA